LYKFDQNLNSLTSKAARVCILFGTGVGITFGLHYGEIDYRYYSIFKNLCKISWLAKNSKIVLKREPTRYPNPQASFLGRAAPRRLLPGLPARGGARGMPMYA